MLPIGSSNFALAVLILALKLFLLPRLTLMPAMFCYLSASIVTSSCYLLGWERTEAAWLPTVAVLGVLTAIECTRWVLVLQSDEERDAVAKWCVLLGLALCLVPAVETAMPYPQYPTLIYNVRLWSALFSTGYLVALLGYCFVVNIGIPKYVIHASILLLRLATMGALLLVPHSLWFAGDLVGGVVNALTLGGWLWLIPANGTIYTHRPPLNKVERG